MHCDIGNLRYALIYSFSTNVLTDFFGFNCESFIASLLLHHLHVLEKRGVLVLFVQHLAVLVVVKYFWRTHLVGRLQGLVSRGHCPRGLSLVHVKMLIEGLD